jgi:hypothetical protein
MRLALLGPAGDDKKSLEAAARFVLEQLRVDRAVYLGVDGALDDVVSAWAKELVGEDPTQQGVWARALRACAEAPPEVIDEYLAAEQDRRALRAFESLPDVATRAVEILAGALAVMIYDKSLLDEEDMLPARLLLFGKSRGPIVKQVGQRWFLSPGSFEEAGVMTLDDDADGISLTVYDKHLDVVRTEQLTVLRGAKLKVGGAGA